MSLIGFFAHAIDIPIQVYVALLLIFALAVSTWLVIILKNILLKYLDENNKKIEILTIIISYITIFNFMYIENLYFAECLVMSISILLYIISAKEIVYKKSSIKALLYTILGIHCYQGTVGVLFTFTFLFSILENKKINKEIIKNFIISGIVAAISIIINFILIIIVGQILGLQQTRIGGTDFFYNIYFIISIIHTILINCCSMFPKYSLILFFSITTLTFIMFLYKHNRKHNMLDYFVLTLIVIFSSFILNIQSLSSFDSARLKFTIGALMGILYIYMLCKTDIFTKKTVHRNIIIIFLIIYFIINVVNARNLMFQHKLTNELEREEMLYIQGRIEDYEKSTSKCIEKIALVCVRGKNYYGFYEDVDKKCIITYSAVRTSWASQPVINFYTQRMLSSYRIAEKEYIKILEESNLEDDDVVFIDNTMYIKIYIF